jgi:hypothetical protein
MHTAVDPKLNSIFGIDNQADKQSLHGQLIRYFFMDPAWIFAEIFNT